MIYLYDSNILYLYLSYTQHLTLLLQPSCSSSQMAIAGLFHDATLNSNLGCRSYHQGPPIALVDV